MYTFNSHSSVNLPFPLISQIFLKCVYFLEFSAVFSLVLPDWVVLWVLQRIRANSNSYNFCQKAYIYHLI